MFGLKRRTNTIEAELRFKTFYPHAFLSELAMKSLTMASVFVCCLNMLNTGAAEAAIVATSGAATEIAPPPSVVKDALESDTDARVFLEQSNLALGSDLTVNVTTPGTFVSPQDPSSTIASGTVVESYFVHMELISGSIATYTGSITFDTDVLGLIWSDGKLDATDSTLGLLSVTYPTGFVGRGSVSTPDGVEFITLSADRKTVSFELAVGSAFIEQFRVVTAVPEPSTLGTLGMVILCIALRRRR